MFLWNGTERSSRLGNTLNLDDGLGVHALERPEKQLSERAPGVEFVDGETLGLNLLPWVKEASHLLVLDAINSRFSSSEQIMELIKNEIPLYRDIKFSDHQIAFQEVLGLTKFRNLFPEYPHWIGVHSVNLSIGVRMKPQVETLMPKFRNKQGVCWGNGVCWKNNFYDIFVMIFVILFWT